VQGDGQIDLEDNRINEGCLKVLALHQPVARDLRRVTAALMVATDLERIADLAVNIAERAIAELVAAMKASPRAVEAGLSLFSVVRHLRRVADHVTNIAEDVVYLAEGALNRHRPEALTD
jgi:phosphate uptake regulator